MHRRKVFHELWAAEPSDLIIMTKNGAECYQRHLNDQFSASHPNKKLQCETYIKIRGMEFEKPNRFDTYSVKLETELKLVLYRGVQ